MPIKQLRPLNGLIRVEAGSMSDRKMKMKSLVIVFVFVMIGAQCRSITLSNEADAGEKTSLNTSAPLKELIALYEENFAKLVNFAMKISKDKDTNEQEIQFLNQLSSLIEQLVQEQSRVNNIYPMLDNDTDFILQAPNNKWTLSVNNVKDLINIMKEIDIVYQDGEITDEHIRIKRAAEGYKGTASFATSEERMTNLLIDIQRQLVQIRKYLDKLCKKHHLTSSTTSEVNSDEVTPVSQPNKISII